MGREFLNFYGSIWTASFIAAIHFSQMLSLSAQKVNVSFLGCANWNTKPPFSPSYSSIFFWKIKNDDETYICNWFFVFYLPLKEFPKYNPKLESYHKQLNLLELYKHTKFHLWEQTKIASIWLRFYHIFFSSSHSSELLHHWRLVSIDEEHSD